MKKNERYVIFSGPKQHSGPGTKYIARDGSVTISRLDAARFYGSNEAAEFAKEHGIELDGAMRYIGTEEFTDYELSH
jgi:hypothetical protein